MAFLDTDELTDFFEAVLLRSTGQELTVQDYTLITGGDVNTAVCLHTDLGVYFLKFRGADHADAFLREAQGLSYLAQALGVHGEDELDQYLPGEGPILDIPQVIGAGAVNGYGYLLLEFLESQVPSKIHWYKLGAGLAQLHRVTGLESGLDYDNYLGSLTQLNQAQPFWPDFWGHQRLLPMAGKALLDDILPLDYFKRIEQMVALLPELLPPVGNSLLHGDLWSGNVVMGKKGRPALVDPAIYYGHREVDLAMTRLFGGFPTLFYESYQEAYPLEAGWADRMEIYTLYPLLVHVNLFGQAYLAGVNKVLNRFGI